MLTASSQATEFTMVSGGKRCSCGMSQCGMPQCVTRRSCSSARAVVRREQALELLAESIARARAPALRWFHQQLAQGLRPCGVHVRTRLGMANLLASGAYWRCDGDCQERAGHARKQTVWQGRHRGCALSEEDSHPLKTLIWLGSIICGKTNKCSKREWT